LSRTTAGPSHSTGSWHGEPSLQEMLSDPIVKALMDADRIKRYELEAELFWIAAIRGLPYGRE